MNKIILKKNILYKFDENIGEKPLTAQEIYFYLNNKTFFDGCSFIKILGDLNIKVSKIPKDVFLKLTKDDNDIRVFFTVMYKGIEYIVPRIQNTQIDYILIDNVCYFLSNIESYFDVFSELNILNKNNLTYTEYIELTQKLKTQNLVFKDFVFDQIEKIKNEDKGFRLKGLNANLYGYQKSGCKWLSFMYENNCGCILGDEMGLGKTLQIICLIGYIKEHLSKMNVLIVCPTSLLVNWQREISKFYPSLTTLIHHGPYRSGDFNKIGAYDVVIVSYSNCINDLSILNMINWDLLALDEAQNIKNPNANRTKYIKSLNRKMSVAITGTPFENHLTDIWSLTDFVIHNYLGSLNNFKKRFEDDYFSAKEIETFLSPIMIRRKVSDVATDLPQKIDIPQALIMTYDEAKYYDEKRVNISCNLLKSTQIEKIQGLRMFCTHPAVYKKSGISLDVDPTVYSSKYERTCEILEEIFLKKEKAIIFTSFNDMNRIFIDDIPKRFNVRTLSITGETAVIDRQKIVDQFNEINGPSLIVLNPKAAGIGLNITGANHIIHYNLEWNPAIEDQASARAYRRGQKKTVFIYRLFYINTIEEVINDRIKRKRDLSEVAIVGNQGNMDSNDLIRALKLSPLGGNVND